MTLPAPNLDDLRFQSDLVDEARKRIIKYCPEWTEYNLSDPGITLIELFSWMTELMCYRLNRVPEKNYIKFLDMLGFQRLPAQSAMTNLTFWLSALFPLSSDDDSKAVVPAGCEVSSEQQDEPVVFSTDRKLEIVSPVLAQLRTEAEFQKNAVSRLGMEIFYPFDRTQPKQGDTFYIGFDPSHNISGHILRLVFTCQPTEAVGIRRDDPPWIWECLTPSGWEEIPLSNFEGEKDTTGGLNNEDGSLVLYTPLLFTPGELHGLNAYWIRCRFEQRKESQGLYAESPRISGLQVFTMGAQVPASHAQIVEDEVLGTSTGESGQIFHTIYSPVIPPEMGEYLEVEEEQDGKTVFVPWQPVSDFSRSTRFDRHYVMDFADGTVHFGPSVRQQDGTVKQYGRIPETGKSIRFEKYRYGGGSRGNLPEGSINSLGMSLAYISRAENLIRSSGGRDQESMDELIMRAQRELQAQKRAVTAADYESFTLRSTAAVARAHCVSPEEITDGTSGTVTVLVVPKVEESLMSGNLHSLHLEDPVRNAIKKYLDQYRILSVNINVREPKYFGVKVRAKIVPREFIKAQEAISAVQNALQKYLSPFDSLVPNSPEKSLKGWEFGRSLLKAEVISVIQQIPEVKYVIDASVLWRSVVPVEEKFSEDDAELRDKELQPIDKILSIPADGLICSLNHEIEVTSLEDAAKESETKS